MDTVATSRTGRPRGFDPDAALESAMRVFWSQGYEGASLADLTRAMGVSRTSMYAAFGNKEALFGRVLDRYTGGPAGYGERALEQSSAAEVAAAFLNGSVAATTNAGDPAGCMGVQGALATGDGARAARETLVAWREDGVARLRDRLARAVEDGDLPLDADPGLLARHLVTVANGVAVQAAGGTSRRDLQAVVDLTLRNWPPG